MSIAFCSKVPVESQIQNAQQLLSHLADIVNQLSLDSKYRSLLNTLKWLNQIQFVTFTKAQVAQQMVQKTHLSNLACQYCNAVLKNILLLLVHLSFIHDTDTFIYEISEGNELLRVIKQPKMVKRDQRTQSINTLFCHGNYFKRLTNIFLSSLSKIARKEIIPSKSAFYHSTDVFKQIVNDSDSQAQSTDVIYQHQQKKLNELYDISKNQMKFYCLWNEFIHNLKKNMKGGVFTKQVIIQNMSQFVHIKELGDLRVQLILHLNAMWCYGVIDSNQVIYRLLEFDKAQKQCKLEEK